VNLLFKVFSHFLYSCGIATLLHNYLFFELSSEFLGFGDGVVEFIAFQGFGAT
jgi:hypothetical protein